MVHEDVTYISISIDEAPHQIFKIDTQIWVYLNFKMRQWQLEKAVKSKMLKKIRWHPFFLVKDRGYKQLLHEYIYKMVSPGLKNGRCYSILINVNAYIHVRRVWTR